MSEDETEIEVEGNEESQGEQVEMPEDSSSDLAGKIKAKNERIQELKQSHEQKEQRIEELETELQELRQQMQAAEEEADRNPWGA